MADDIMTRTRTYLGSGVRRDVLWVAHPQQDVQGALLVVVHRGQHGLPASRSLSVHHPSIRDASPQLISADDGAAGGIEGTYNTATSKSGNIDRSASTCGLTAPWTLSFVCTFVFAAVSGICTFVSVSELWASGAALEVAIVSSSAGLGGSAGVASSASASSSKGFVAMVEVAGAECAAAPAD